MTHLHLVDQVVVETTKVEDLHQELQTKDIQADLTAAEELVDQAEEVVELELHLQLQVQLFKELVVAQQRARLAELVAAETAAKETKKVNQEELTQVVDQELED